MSSFYFLKQPQVNDVFSPSVQIIICKNNMQIFYKKISRVFNENKMFNLFIKKNLYIFFKLIIILFPNIID
jgi:hypothetical protein